MLRLIKEHPEGKLELPDADLSGVDFRQELRKAWYRGFVPRWLDLRNADLRRADLRNALLRGADLREAHLPRAKLLNANLEMADLEGANLKVADLRGAKLGGSILRNVVLGPANLQGADLKYDKISSTRIRIFSWVASQ